MEDSVQMLHMTLSDVAALARVQRPVVSMWRTRSEDTSNPFPAPLPVAGATEVFDGHQVAGWLTATGRGNNREAAADLAAFARLPRREGQDRGARPTFEGLTALLTLKSLMDGRLDGLSTADLLDAADDFDPDDEFIYSELAALGPDIESVAHFADRLADSAYNPAEAFERLLADRFRSGLREHADTALTGTAVELVASSAVELAATLPGDPVFADSTGGGDLLLGVVAALGDHASASVLTTDDGGAAARLLRRRLRVHGVESGSIRSGTDGTFQLAGPAVHVGQYPAPGQGTQDAAGILAAVEQTVMQMDDQQRAVVIAPAKVLSDALSAKVPSELRSGLLRSGRVRAVVRLPAGLLRSRPRQYQALWVLGPSFAEVDIADKWTMVADLSETQLEGVVQDLISDIVASMGDLPTVRAHSFRFARLVRTRTLLASRAGLIAAARRDTGQQRSSAEDALRVEQLAGNLAGHGQDGNVLGFSVAPSTQGQLLGTETVAAFLAAGNLKYIQGNRLEAPGPARAATTGSHDAGPRIIGVRELSEPDAPARRIGMLQFAAQCPSGRLTQPGDVVFCTSPRPAAMVDTQGGSAVVFPARVLRIDRGDPGGLVPAVVAADINALPQAAKDWRHWRLRRTPDAQRSPLEAVLEQLQHEQDAARERLRGLEELARLMLDGVAGGSLTLTDPISRAGTTEGTL